jgi:hypothetical protein
MPRNFNLTRLRNDPQLLARVILGVLLFANLVAAFFVFFPPGGSAEQITNRSSALSRELSTKQAALRRTRELASKMDAGRKQGDTFLTDYFLNRRSTYSTIVSELGEMAKRAGMKLKEHALNEEVIEGSDDLNILTITGNYEGRYADLMQFIRLLDQSRRLIIIESLSASPQQGANLLSVQMKLNGFIREAPLGPKVTAELRGPQ